MISTPIYFEATDKVKLFGILSLPENFKKNEVLISIHGQASNCTKDREQIIGKFLIEKNIPYF